MALLIAASGFFSASETALFYLSHDDVREFRRGSVAQRLAARLLEDPDRLLTSVLFWNLVINLMYFAVSVVVTQELSRSGHRVVAGAFGFLSLGGIILAGEVFPKSLAVSFKSSLAGMVSFPLTVAVRVLDPLQPRFYRITQSLRRAFWHHLARESHVDVADLERAVEMSQLNADIVEQETQVLHNVLDLAEIPVEEVMRPRGTYPVIAPGQDLSSIKQDLRSVVYVVVTAEDSEDVNQVIPLNSAIRTPSDQLHRVAEDVVIVPWCSNLATTLQQLRDTFTRVAVVINEYGESIGIVTFEDIIDTMLVAQPSRARRVLNREPVLEVAPGRYHVEGITTLRYLARRLGVSYVAEADGQITVAGMLQDELGHIPERGDSCRWMNHEVRVIDVTRKGRLRAMVIADPSQSELDA